jgi:alkanesulfonate monooxygenase SsuD/methylene tetrahydromethanopterin reductase-like flavin-dependent oxidoreductase (luciferase family)
MVLKMNGHGSAAPQARFSIFDWLDESGRGFAQTYDERLRLLEQADEFGFYGYHLAEHHGTSLSTTSSPMVFLSAVAQRTTRLRLGALTWVLPLYNPLRLLEELCMLDQLSHGRLDIGVGRGSSPHERQRFGVSPEESRPRFEEALQLLVMGFRMGEFRFHGEFYDYDGLKTRYRPYQQPYPPLWYPTSSMDSIKYMAAEGFNMAISARHWPSFEQVCQALALYRREYALHRDDPGRLNAHVAEPFLGLSIHIHVAESDAKARDQARPAYAKFHENFTRRYFELGIEKYPRQEDFDRLVDEEKVLCGSPDTVRTTLERILEQSGANYVLGAFMFGNLSEEHERRSLELFAREVMPAFASPSAAVV